jgi:transcription initiation factor TFIID subunit TAF12
MENCEIMNKLREVYGDTALTTKDMKVLLEELPYSKTNMLIPSLIREGALIRVKKGWVKFPSYIIHHDRIDRAINTIRKNMAKYKNAWRNRPKDNKSDIQKAIDLLLSTGEYEIYHIEKVIKKTQIL